MQNERKTKAVALIRSMCAIANNPTQKMALKTAADALESSSLWDEQPQLEPEPDPRHYELSTPEEDEDDDYGYEG